MSEPTFTRTRLTLTVLSEEPIPDGTKLKTILEDCDTGDYILASVDTVNETLTPKSMAEALTAAGSDPEFFEIELSEPNNRDHLLYTFVVRSNMGERNWQAEDEQHACEQHQDAFPDELIVWVRKLIR